MFGINYSSYNLSIMFIIYQFIINVYHVYIYVYIYIYIYIWQLVTTRQFCSDKVTIILHGISRHPWYSKQRDHYERGKPTVQWTWCIHGFNYFSRDELVFYGNEFMEISLITSNLFILWLNVDNDFRESFCTQAFYYQSWIRNTLCQSGGK